MRIDIVGLPATGKSTLAEAISKKLSIPHIHLDRFWFETGGHKTSKGSPERKKVLDTIKIQVDALTSQKDWVSDGAYFELQSIIAPQADQIIFLEIPLWRRLLNHAQRMFYPEKRHKENGFWNDVVFFWELTKRTYTKKQKFQRFIAEHRDKVLILHSYKEIAQYLDGLK